MISEQQFSRFNTECKKDGSSHDLRQDLTRALKEGDVSYLESVDWSEYCRNGVGRMSDDSLTQGRYLVVVACTMGGIYAIEAGVDSEVSMNLSDYYIRMCQKVYTVRELTQLTGNALIHYAIFIERQKKLPQSKTVSRAVEYVNNHIFQPIQVQEIAGAMGMDVSYLSRHFKEEMGVSIKDFIHQEKLKEAQNLMKYTEMSLTEIAGQLSYSDSSHFTRVCKAYLNCTPKELKYSVQSQ